MALTIIIDQHEITTALAKHVRDLMPHLPEDMLISADLSATRGPSGYTAEIKLLTPEQAEEIERAERAAERAAKKAETTPAAPKPVRVKTSGNKPLGIAAAARKAKQEDNPEPEVTEDTSVTEVLQAEPEVVEAAPTEEEIAREADAMDLNAVAQEPEVEVEAEAQPEAETETVKVEQVGGSDEPVAPRRSLFGGLSKPVNE